MQRPWWGQGGRDGRDLKRLLRCCRRTNAPDRSAFLGAAYAVLARLLALQGGHENAGGMQVGCF